MKGEGEVGGVVLVSALWPGGSADNSVWPGGVK